MRRRGVRELSRQQVLVELEDLGFDKPTGHRSTRYLRDTLRTLRTSGRASVQDDQGQGTTGMLNGLSKEPEWGGLDSTMEFRVSGEAGWFRFLAHVVNPRTGNDWVDAYGGDGKHVQFRSFDPRRIVVRNGQPVTRPCKRATQDNGQRQEEDEG